MKLREGRGCCLLYNEDERSSSRGLERVHLSCVAAYAFMFGTLHVSCPRFCTVSVREANPAGGPVRPGQVLHVRLEVHRPWWRWFWRSRVAVAVSGTTFDESELLHPWPA